MKKMLFFFAFTCFVYLSQAATPNPGAPTHPQKNNSYFSMDESAVQAEMTELNALEDYVVANEGTTLSQLKTENSSLVANVAGTNGLGIESALSKGGGMPTWAIILIVVGGVLLLVVVLCCILGSLGSAQ